jgi:hypothetical protein
MSSRHTLVEQRKPALYLPLHNTAPPPNQRASHTPTRTAHALLLTPHAPTQSLRRTARALWCRPSRRSVSVRPYVAPAHTHTHRGADTHTEAQTHTRTHTEAHTHTHRGTHTHMRTHTYIHIHTYAHTHIHTYTRKQHRHRHIHGPFGQPHDGADVCMVCRSGRRSSVAPSGTRTAAARRLRRSGRGPPPRCPWTVWTTTERVPVPVCTVCSTSESNCVCVCVCLSVVGTL